MAQDKALTKQKLSELWQNDQVKVLDTQGKKYVIVSDVHLGNGGGADDFRDNEKILDIALDYYLKEGYSLILLGDIEEFWQFDLEQIIQRYENSIYKKIRAFGDDRVYRIFGNHDIEWSTVCDPTKNAQAKCELATEALKLKDQHGDPRILLVHGHQGSTESDKHSWFSRFFVRVFKKIEPVAKWTKFYGHPSATKSQITKDYEQIFYSWAKDSKVMLICGHSHRAIFASKSYFDQLEDKIADLRAELLVNHPDKKRVKEILKKIKRLESKLSDEREKRDIEPLESDDREPLPCYFNSGCALYTDGITTIEIANDEISLVKWHTKEASREVYDHASLSALIAKTVNQSV